MNTNKGAKVRPIELTITGAQAAKIRKKARAVGMRVARFALNHLDFGLALTDPDDHEMKVRDPLPYVSELKSHSLDTGIPVHELSMMCLNAGLEQLRNGALKVKAKAEPAMLPIFLPAKTVKRLRAIGHAADLESPDNAVADAILTDMVESFERHPGEAFGWCRDGWDMSDESQAKAVEALAMLERKWSVEATREARVKEAVA